jgi:hypothetical protein
MINTKALFRSQKMPPTGILLFKAFNISLIKLYEASSVDESHLKPYWSVDNILFFMWQSNRTNITFSITFEKDVSNDIGL